MKIIFNIIVIVVVVTAERNFILYSWLRRYNLVELPVRACVRVCKRICDGILFKYKVNKEWEEKTYSLTQSGSVSSTGISSRILRKFYYATQFTLKNTISLGVHIFFFAFIFVCVWFNLQKWGQHTFLVYQQSSVHFP